MATAKQIVRTGTYYTWSGETVETTRVAVEGGVAGAYVQKNGGVFSAEIVRREPSFKTFWACKHGHPNRRTAGECADAQVAALTATGGAR